MNRNQRRAPRRKETSNRSSATKARGTSESTHSPPRIKNKDKSVPVHNRCCYVRPERTDFGQSFKARAPSPEKQDDMVQKRRSEQYQAMLEEQYGFDPAIPKMKNLKTLVCDHSTKIDFHKDYVNQTTGNAPAYVETAHSTQWQTVDDIDDIDKLLIDDDHIPLCERIPKHIFISEVPRVKIIAEKFSKYKRNNLELRRLEEKVVCVEYDIFNQAANDVLKPAQRMRAFFSIKPVFDNDESENKGGALPRLPSNIKHKFDVLDDDLKKLTDKEIEIIDGKIEENKSYLEDLRRILKRKQVINAKKNKTSLDLQSLYEMARRDGSTPGCDYSEVNFLSKAELQEIKDLILQRCTSSAHGIRRRRVKRKKEKESALDVGVISESIVAELLREDAKHKVYQ